MDWEYQEILLIKLVKQKGLHREDATILTPDERLTLWEEIAQRCSYSTAETCQLKWQNIRTEYEQDRSLPKYRHGLLNFLDELITLSTEETVKSQKVSNKLCVLQAIRSSEPTTSQNPSSSEKPLLSDNSSTIENQSISDEAHTENKISQPEKSFSSKTNEEPYTSKERSQMINSSPENTSSKYNILENKEITKSMLNINGKNTNCSGQKKGIKRKIQDSANDEDEVAALKNINNELTRQTVSPSVEDIEGKQNDDAYKIDSITQKINFTLDDINEKVIIKGIVELDEIKETGYSNEADVSKSKSKEQEKTVIENIIHVEAEKLMSVDESETDTTSKHNEQKNTAAQKNVQKDISEKIIGKSIIDEIAVLNANNDDHEKNVIENNLKEQNNMTDVIIETDLKLQQAMPVNNSDVIQQNIQTSNSTKYEQEKAIAKSNTDNDNNERIRIKTEIEDISVDNLTETDVTNANTGKQVKDITKNDIQIDRRLLKEKLMNMDHNSFYGAMADLICQLPEDKQKEMRLQIGVLLADAEIELLTNKMPE